MPSKTKPRPAVITRRMGEKQVPPAPPKRRAGQRMGLTTEQILGAARKCLALHPGPLVVKLVAADLGVAHNSITSRLRRNATTLERELTKDFLLGLSKPMLPGEDWKTNLQTLFRDALHTCETHPGLARAITPWIGQDPTLCGEFTERMLHVLGAAGLSADASADHHDVILATLCGMLAIRFPDFGGDPQGWAKAVSRNIDGVDARRLPILHSGAKSITAHAVEKSMKKPKPDHRFADKMASVAIRYIIM